MNRRLILVENLKKSDFDSFWEVYPKKIGKGIAKRSFDKALKRSSLEAIIFGLNRSVEYWLRSKTEYAYIPNPATWLNQDRWLDDYPSQVNTSWVDDMRTELE